MPLFYKLIAGLLVSFLMLSEAVAQPAGFHAGSFIPEFGPIADVPGMQAIPPDATFKVSFDVNDAAAAGELNRSLVSGARFLNMHVEAGVKPENIRLAFVIHGQAVRDVTVDTHYQPLMAGKNANAALVAALRSKGVEVYVCGQSAAYYGVSKGDLLPGVVMSLSAMTAHALLQNEGYTLNPF